MKKLIILGVSIILFGCAKTQVMESSQETILETTVEVPSSSDTESVEKDTSKGETESVVTPQTTKESSKIEGKGVMAMDSSKADLNKYNEVKELKLSDETSVEFILSTDYSLKDFKIQSISYDGVDLIIEDTLFETATFTPESAVKISTYIPPMFSNLLVSYKDQNSKMVYYFIDSNMEGSGEGVSLTDAYEVVNKE